MKLEDSIALGLLIFIFGAVIYWSVSTSSKNKRKTKHASFENPVISVVSEDAAASLSVRNHSVPVTIFLIAVSVAISLLSKMGSSTADLAALLIAAPKNHGFQDVLSGEVWRLITPIFLHFGPLHLLFNMLWLWDLGSLMERKKGHLFVLGCYSFDSRSQGVRGGLRVAAGITGLVVVFYVAVMFGSFMSGMDGIEESFVSKGGRVYNLDISIPGCKTVQHLPLST